MAVPVKSGAICGAFLCGQKVAGQVDWTVPHARPQLLLNPGLWLWFLTPPTYVAIGQPKLLLAARAFALEIQQAPAFARPVLELVPRLAFGGLIITILPERPFLSLEARSFANEISQSPPMQRPVLELVVRKAGPLVPILLPTEGVDLTLVPAVPVEGPLLVPTEGEDWLLIPTTEAVG